MLWLGRRCFSCCRDRPLVLWGCRCIGIDIFLGRFSAVLLLLVYFPHPACLTRHMQSCFFCQQLGVKSQSNKKYVWHRKGWVCVKCSLVSSGRGGFFKSEGVRQGFLLRGTGEQSVTKSIHWYWSVISFHMTLSYSAHCVLQSSIACIIVLCVCVCVTL